MRLLCQCLCCLLVSVNLVACVSLQPVTTTDHPHRLSFSKRQQRLLPVKNWQLSGAVGIIARASGDTANVAWRQLGDHFQIELSGPLGVGTVDVRGHVGNVRLSTSEGKKLQAHDPESLVYQATGWSIPVTPLQYWIRGLPLPNQPYQAKFDAYGRLAQLQQAGWTVQFQAYQNFPAFDLPIRLRLTRQDLIVKLVIKHWQLL